MKNKIYLLIYLILILDGCVTSGTHGSIVGYQYPVSKYSLENAVLKVIASNNNILRDTVKAWNDSTKNDYYNDGINYMSITISKGELKNSYTLKYAGDPEHWDTSNVSQIFIAYAFDREGNGGSAGNGGIAWYKLGIKEKLVNLFESDFINKIDLELGQTHIKFQQ